MPSFLSWCRETLPETDQLQGSKEPRVAVIQFNGEEGIIRLAGGPGDRWLRPKAAKSKPLQGRGERKVRTPLRGPLAVCGRRKAGAEWTTELSTWATRLVTPGGEVEDGGVNSPLQRRHGECHRE